MLTVWYSLIVAVIMLMIDQCSKLIIMNNLNIGDKIPVIDNFFSIEYINNYGAAFGMFQHFRYAFIVLTAAVIALALIALLRGKVKNKLLIWSLSLIISGGFGNLVDRVFHSGGYVVDFLKFEFSWFPYVFNVADICVVFGGGLLILYLILDIFKARKIADKQENDE